MVSHRQHKSVLQALPMRTLTTRLTPAVLILLAVTLMVFHKMDALPVEQMRVALTDKMTPVMTAVSSPFVALTDSFDGIATLRQLRAENMQLREENAKLQKWYENALRYQAENQSFRELLNVKADPALTYVTTRVVSDPGGSFVKSVLLPVGTNDRVSKGDAVMSGQGLIGRVTEAGDRSARVLLVTDLNSHIPVIIQNTRTKAILAGKNTDLLKLERLPIDSGLTVGQRVVTSGDGGQLPPDVPIGVIVEVGADGVFVKPLSEIEKITYVQVINADADRGLSTGEISSPVDKHSSKRK